MPRNQIGEPRLYPMTEPEILREQARRLRALAARDDTAGIRELLCHLAEQCERLADSLERERG